MLMRAAVLLRTIRMDVHTSRGAVPVALFAVLSAGCIQDYRIAIEQIRNARFETLPIINHVSRRDFGKKVAERIGYEKQRGDHVYWSAVTQAFDLAKPGTDLARLYRERNTAEIAGYFVGRRNRIVLIDSEKADRAGRQTTLVHELAHALGRQFWPKHKFANHDEVGAFKALDEGVALLTTLAVAGRIAGYPVEGQLLHQYRRVKLYMEELTRAVRSSSAQQALPHYFRRWEEFEQVAGLRLAWDLYAVGRFDLINEALRRPPRSTEQILSWQRYVTGEMPTSIETIRSPSGWKSLASGTMGQFGVIAYLEECGSTNASEFAVGWGGDAFGVLEKDGQLLLLWSTVWDSESAAWTFEELVRRRARCWKRTTQPWAIDERIRVLRRDRRVAVLRGTPAETARVEELLETLVELRHQDPDPQPPFANLSTGPFDAHQRTVEGGVLIDRLLGLRLQVPPGFSMRSSESADLDIVSGADSVSVTLNWLPPRLQKEQIEREFASEGVVVGRGRTRLPIGDAETLDMVPRQGSKRGSIAIVPFCGGIASLVLVTIGSSAERLSQIARWIHEVKMDMPSPLVCHD